MKAIFNNMVVTELSLSLEDRGVQYGDGLFETIIVKNGQARLITLHLNRLKNGTEALQMNLPDYFTPSFIQDQITKLAKLNDLNSMVTNIVVWRKPGGLYTPKDDQLNWLLKCRPYQQKEKTLWKVGICTSVTNCYQVYSPYKSNTLKYVLAGIEKKNKHMDDLIILDVNGYVSETVDKNLFWRRDDTYYTPALATGCIAGVMRQHLMEQYSRESKKVVEGSFEVNELKTADSLFACNASGLYTIEAVGDD